MLARQAADRSMEMHSGEWKKTSDGCFEVRNFGQGEMRRERERERDRRSRKGARDNCTYVALFN